MHISCRVRGTGKNFGSYMRIGVMEDALVSYNHEEEVRGIHVSMGNDETKSNERRVT
jgi:hypothetical protein